jgi:hypothetical protein
VVACFVPILLLTLGIEFSGAFLWPPVVAVGVVTGWFLREAYLDGRARGLSRARSVLAALKGVVVGWWSTGA